MHACAILLIKRLPLSDCDTPTRLQSSANGSKLACDYRAPTWQGSCFPELPMAWLIVLASSANSLKLRDGCKWRVGNDSTEVKRLGHRSWSGERQGGCPPTSSLVVVIRAHHSRSYPYTGQQNKRTQTGRFNHISEPSAFDTPQHKTHAQRAQRQQGPPEGRARGQGR